MRTIAKANTQAKMVELINQAKTGLKAHVGPVYASEANPVNIVSVLKDYSCPNVVNGTFSAGQFWEKLYIQKAGKKLKTIVNVPCPQQAIDQSNLDDDEELTSLNDLDE